MNKKNKFKWKNLVLLIIIFTCFITFIISGYMVFRRLYDKYKTNTLIDNINSLVVIQENDTLTKEEILDNTANSVVSLDEENKINYYYEYLKVPFMSVDFEALKAINSEVVGWLNVKAASVNYPYVQTSNNKYYLTHSFDKSNRESGWVFLDYRNSVDNSNKNTIIYAHGGHSLAMFGPLKKLYDEPTWYQNSDNHYIKISTDTYNFVYKVFSLYVIETTSDYLQIDFSSDIDYLAFLNKLKNRSYYEFNTSLLETDKIITLSTCYNQKEKLVLHGKLIKQEKR